MSTFNFGGTNVLTKSGSIVTMDNVTLDSNVTIPAAGVTGTLGSGVFPAGMMRFLSQVYKTGTQDASGEVMTTGQLSVTSGSKILLQFMLNYEDSASSTTSRFSFSLSPPTL